MSNRVATTVAILTVALIVCSSHRLSAQERPPLPPSRGDSLLEQGRWAEAEAVYYQQSERAPRNPIKRAALGRFIAMKGAVRPGMVLIEEARRFGLDAAVARELLTPLRAILQWRAEATELQHDTTLLVRHGADERALFQLPVPRTGSDGRPLIHLGDVHEIVWHDIVDRTIGLDSIGAPTRPIGFEVFEAFSPSLDVDSGELTLHTNPRSALSASGRRYPVLRSPRGTRVLLGDRRVVPLADALRDLAPAWWQLDLVHGILVVR